MSCHSIHDLFQKRVELDIRAYIDTRLNKSMDEQTWQQGLTILIEKGLIETRP